MKRMLKCGIMIIACCLLITSVCNLLSYLQASQKSHAIHDALARFHADSTLPALTMTNKPSSADGHVKDVTVWANRQDDGDSSSLVSAGPEASTSDDKDVRPSALSLLHEGNPDCIAWLSIEGTSIDYPVMSRPNDRDYYLHRDFYGSTSKAGSLYLAEICDVLKSDNLTVYGHNMKDGSMFAPLLNYRDQSFYEAHPLIHFETLHDEADYEIIAVLTTRVYTDHDFAFYSFANAHSEQEYDAYVDSCKARALYSIDKSARYGDRLLTLSTCEYSQKNGRFLVVARRLENGSE